MDATFHPRVISRRRASLQGQEPDMAFAYLAIDRRLALIFACFNPLFISF
jgi:hypothetical protein